MLRLENIKKDYVMKGATVHALKGISISFRKSEFVSILGPSGCGKTTLLNILGGLDQYTSGDLFIEGKSTKDFTDHDWDIYRNHRIGFIFQSYNLIPHENILDNVSLALTISGIGKEERTERAKKALDKVGLKDMYKKMPNQLSGGQCQRVAIARALVNEPEILLADEPTGALDSVTSVQIMDLIKEISKEKLVIMVTHNPELAMKYSTRIVRLLDGELISDSMPFSKEDEEKEVEDLKNGVGLTQEEKDKKEEKEKAKMSWWTAFRLSAKNLLSKSKRTVMTIIASSIGIVGVSAVLAVRDGVTGYIDGMQDEMLSGNPIEVAEEGFDLSSITNQMTNAQKRDITKEAAKDGYVNVDFVTERLINSAKDMGISMIQNDITQDYMDYIDAMPKEYYQDIVKYYGIDISNNFYTSDVIDGINGNVDSKDENIFSLSAITSIATDILSRKLSSTGYSSYASLVSGYAGTFAQSLNDKDYILSQYDLVEGDVAQNEDEIMIVLSKDDALTDFTLTLLGYYSQDDFLNVVYKYNTDENGKPDSNYNDELYQSKKQIAIDSLMRKPFYYYPNDMVFTENTDDKTKSTRPFTYSWLKDPSWPTEGYQLKVTGILKPKEGRQYVSLSSGFYYTPAFAKRFIEDNINSRLVSYMQEEKEKAEAQDKTYSGLISTDITLNTAMGSMRVQQGIYYTYDYSLEGNLYKDNTALVGNSDSLSSLLSTLASSAGYSGNQTGKSASLTFRDVGGVDIPSRIDFYPNSFDSKYLVTDYLDQWNQDKTLSVNGKDIASDGRKEIRYSDNLAVVISMVNNVINVTSIALIAFTALSLVVSTVMIAIITYVSVMERIKEIGIIRALGGRKKDVSQLFNAETFIIGFTAGIFGILVTYLIQVILNSVVHAHYAAISTIAALPFTSALIIIAISVLLTIIAGLIPARSAARKDPVEALRTE